MSHDNHILTTAFANFEKVCEEIAPDQRTITTIVLDAAMIDPVRQTVSIQLPWHFIYMIYLDMTTCESSLSGGIPPVEILLDVAEHKFVGSYALRQNIIPRCARILPLALMPNATARLTIMLREKPQFLRAIEAHELSIVIVANPRAMDTRVARCAHGPMYEEPCALLWSEDATQTYRRCLIFLHGTVIRALN